MKLLIIEDDPNKAHEIINFIKTIESDIVWDYKKSYQSGLKELQSNNFDLVILDMSLPTFDVNKGEDAYKFRHLAGQEILNEIKRKAINAKVIILTQFERFGEGKQYITLSDLKLQLRKNYREIYLNTISYQPNKTNWKIELLEIINQFL